MWAVIQLVISKEELKWGKVRDYIWTLHYSVAYLYPNISQNNLSCMKFHLILTVLNLRSFPITSQIDSPKQGYSSPLQSLWQQRSKSIVLGHLSLLAPNFRSTKLIKARILKPFSSYSFSSLSPISLSFLPV